MLEQNLKGHDRRAYLNYKRVMSVKGTECSELCGVMYVKPSLKSRRENKGLVYTQCMHASHKVGSGVGCT